MPSLLLWIFVFSFLSSSQHQYAYKKTKPLLQLQYFQTRFQHFPLWGFVPHHLLGCWYSVMYRQYAGHTLNAPGEPGSEQQTEKPASKDKLKRKHLLFPIVQLVPWKKKKKMHQNDFLNSSGFEKSLTRGQIPSLLHKCLKDPHLTKHVCFFFSKGWILAVAFILGVRGCCMLHFSYTSRLTLSSR